MTRLFDREPCSASDAEIHLIPMPWDATASFRKGTAGFPAQFLELSDQIDAFDHRFPRHAERGFFWDVAAVAVPKLPDLPSEAWLNKVSKQMAEDLCKAVKAKLTNGKKVMIVGGEHSVSLGSVQAHSEAHSDLGVLQVDAHMDLRPGYEGYDYSHAAIMHHVNQLPGISKIVQVGIRDYCEQEYKTMVASDGRIRTYFDDQLAGRQCEGETWQSIAKDIVSQLPQKVYVTVDCDGLCPGYAPHTGTPVPGGVTYHQLLYLLQVVSESGREIVGIDLVEVASVEEDVIFGTHLLYNLSQYL